MGSAYSGTSHRRASLGLGGLGGFALGGSRSGGFSGSLGRSLVGQEFLLPSGHRLLGGFALGMGLPQDSFRRNWRKNISRGAALYYPPQPPDLGREQFGVAPHTDFGVLTVLWQDDSGGLQVLDKQKQWVTAHPIPGTLVVNVGDLLARWTNDGFASTPHRVINTTGHARYSMPVAVDPDHDTLIDPRVVCAPGETPRYEPITCGDYLNWRFNKAFAYRKA